MIIGKIATVTLVSGRHLGVEWTLENLDCLPFTHVQSWLAIQIMLSNLSTVVNIQYVKVGLWCDGLMNLLELQLHGIQVLHVWLQALTAWDFTQVCQLVCNKAEGIAVWSKYVCCNLFVALFLWFGCARDWENWCGSNWSWIPLGSGAKTSHSLYQPFQFCLKQTFEQNAVHPCVKTKKFSKWKIVA